MHDYRILKANIYSVLILVLLLLAISGCQGGSTLQPVDLVPTSPDQEIDYSLAAEPIGFPHVAYNAMADEFSVVYCEMPRNRLCYSSYPLVDMNDQTTTVDSKAQGLNDCVADELGQLHLIYTRFTEDRTSQAIIADTPVQVIYRGYSSGEWSNRVVVMESFSGLTVKSLDLLLLGNERLEASIQIQDDDDHHYLLQAIGSLTGDWNQVTPGNAHKADAIEHLSYDAAVVDTDIGQVVYQAIQTDGRVVVHRDATDQALVDEDAVTSTICLTPLPDGSGVGIVWCGDGGTVCYGEWTESGFSSEPINDIDGMNPTLAYRDDCAPRIFYPVRRVGSPTGPQGQLVSSYYADEWTQGQTNYWQSYAITNFSASTEYGTEATVDATVADNGVLMFVTISSRGGVEEMWAVPEDIDWPPVN